ncbi:hypothetical protein [Taibaiella chishuiensis]|uniref:Phosphopeptide-binding protein n=1 Tax=Taibaiella chishuiensis TaxID=1434707 RepID=A0A2P8D9J5_9BACT|nr:hypothetical protein [Taibaiella chishuiensis]PSK93898.1 hypothetical protein B0I18_10146 [Taibaiella chishuiensis]
MNLKSLAVTSASVALLALTACNNGGSNTTEAPTDTTAAQQPAAPAGPITIKPVAGSPEFPDAQLGIKNVKAELQGSDSVKITIDYDVKNYELKSQTSDAGTKACNNSKDGQHIHFILDNQPYTALYEPTRTFTVAVKSEHYLMSFLSRSYHESIKTPKAGVLYHFSVDEKGKLSKLEIPKTPMIFYSRPKGEYVGQDTKNLLLDFYVYNTTLGADASKVKVDVNGTTFDIDKWQPYFIENAPMGDVTVKVQLTDKDGKAIEGVNTSVSRSVKLAAQEPVK